MALKRGTAAIPRGLPLESAWARMCFGGPDTSSGAEFVLSNSRDSSQASFLNSALGWLPSDGHSGNIFFFMCMGLLCACMSVHASCPQRPEEGAISPGIRLQEDESQIQILCQYKCS